MWKELFSGSSLMELKRHIYLQELKDLCNRDNIRNTVRFYPLTHKNISVHNLTKNKGHYNIIITVNVRRGGMTAVYNNKEELIGYDRKGYSITDIKQCMVKGKGFEYNGSIQEVWKYINQNLFIKFNKITDNYNYFYKDIKIILLYKKVANRDV